jgi:hypothetical protein
VHQAVLRPFYGGGEGYVLSRLVELSFRISRQAMLQIGFSGKLVRKFLLRGHRSSVSACCLGESFIFLQRRKSGFGSFAIRHVQKLTFGFGLIHGLGFATALHDLGADAIVGGAIAAK